MRYIKILFLTVLLGLIMPVSLWASENITPVIKLNGANIKFEKENMPCPFIDESKTMVPLRVLSEKMGYAVTWNQRTKAVVISKDGSTMKISDNGSEVILNNKKVLADINMIFKSGRIFVPVRFVTQNFGCAVNFIKEKGQFVITVNNKGNKLQAPENVISRAGKTTRYINKYEMSSTAYTYTGHNTATGISPRRGIVAVDPEVIPLGTRLYVEGYGYCVALDTGGAVKGKRIDLFMQTRSKALRWGRRNVNVYVLESNEAS